MSASAMLTREPESFNGVLSLNQNSVGGGIPVAIHWKVTLSISLTMYSTCDELTVGTTAETKHTAHLHACNNRSKLNHLRQLGHNRNYIKNTHHFGTVVTFESTYIIYHKIAIPSTSPYTVSDEFCESLPTTLFPSQRYAPASDGSISVMVREL